MGIFHSFLLVYQSRVAPYISAASRQVVIFLTITFPTASIGACKVLLKFLKAFTDKPPNKTSEWPEKNGKNQWFLFIQ